MEVFEKEGRDEHLHWTWAHVLDPQLCYILNGVGSLAGSR
jgi:hypothetical protein